MTSFGITTNVFQTPNRLWLADDHGTEIMPGYALDLTQFVAAQHYPNGFLLDGIVLGVLASGKAVPYLGSASDGRQTPIGISFNTASMFLPGSFPTAAQTNVAMPVLMHGFVYPSKLPLNSTNAAGGGYIDTAARTALKNIVFLDNVA